MAKKTEMQIQLSTGRTLFLLDDGRVADIEHENLMHEVWESLDHFIREATDPFQLVGYGYQVELDPERYRT
jgi:hypothetical protein